MGQLIVRFMFGNRTLYFKGIVSMEKTVANFIAKHHLLTRDQTVLVAVSGGPDSLCLLHLLMKLRRKWDLQLHVVTIDHQLREGSKEDVQFVEQFAEDAGIPCTVIAVETPTYQAKEQIGTQVAARDLRYEAFAKVMKQYDHPTLALGQHGDDQVETVFMQMMRFAEPGYVKGMPITRPFANGQIIRPLLCVTKEEILMYCEDENLQARIDPSNEETIYTRNAVRKIILPFLKQYNESVHQTIQHYTEATRADETYLLQQAQKMFDAVIHIDDNDRSIHFDIAEFCTYSIALQRRVYHLILNYLYEELPKASTYTNETLFLSVLERTDGTEIHTYPQGLELVRSYSSVQFRWGHSKIQQDKLDKQLAVPGTIMLSSTANLSVEAEGLRDTDSVPDFVVRLKEEDFPLNVRYLKPGDRMTWSGLQGTKKVSRILIDAKTPLALRQEIPLVVSARGDILWIIGYRKGIPQQDVEAGYLYAFYLDTNIAIHNE